MTVQETEKVTKMIALFGRLDENGQEVLIGYTKGMIDMKEIINARKEASS